MLGFSVIGTPAGFEIISISDNKQLPVDRLVDLDNTVINIFPDTDILMVIREVTKDYYRHYFIYYRYALEMSTTRSGTYFGSVVTITDKFPTRPYFVTYALRDLAEVIQRECLTPENRFRRNIKNLSFDLPPSLNDLKKNLENNKLPQGKYNKKGFFSIGDEFELKSYNELIKEIFENPLLADYKILYASNFKDVWDDVRSKGQLEILSLKKLAAIKDEEEKTQQQQKLEQEKIRLQLQAENEERQRRVREEKEEIERKLQLKLPTQKELPERLLNLEGKVRKLEQIIENITRNPDSQIKKESLLNKISPNYSDLTWTGFFVILGSVLVILLIAGLGLYSCLQNGNEKKNANANTNTIATHHNSQSSPQIRTNDDSPTTSVLTSEAATKTVQIKYKEEAKKRIPNVETVGDLINRIKSQCENSKITVTDKDLIDSIRRINTSIKGENSKKGDEFTDAEIAEVKLVDIKGDVVFEVPSGCKLHEIDKDNYTLNRK